MNSTPASARLLLPADLSFSQNFFVRVPKDVKFHTEANVRERPRDHAKRGFKFASVDKSNWADLEIERRFD